jgi:hypothetical protein
MWEELAMPGQAHLLQAIWRFRLQVFAKSFLPQQTIHSNFTLTSNWKAGPRWEPQPRGEVVVFKLANPEDQSIVSIRSIENSTYCMSRGCMFV